MDVTRRLNFREDYLYTAKPKPWAFDCKPRRLNQQHLANPCQRVGGNQEGWTIEISATNLEIGINYLVEIEEVIETGATTSSRQIDRRFRRRLPPELVEISVPENSSTLTVKSGDNKAEIKGMELLRISAHSYTRGQQNHPSLLAPPSLKR